MKFPSYVQNPFCMNFVMAQCNKLFDLLPFCKRSTINLTDLNHSNNKCKLGSVEDNDSMYVKDNFYQDTNF